MPDLMRYSQYGQEERIQQYFRWNPPLSRVFIDVGAFDGLTHSNTRLLFQLGWSGVCIEPLSRNFEKLSALYAGTGVTTLRKAVSNYIGHASIHLPNDSLPSAIATLNVDERDRWPGVDWRSEDVEVTTLEQILDSLKIPAFDFLKVDAEGEDLNVLDGLNLARFRPSLILIEHNGRSDRHRILGLARSHGYSLWIDNGVDFFLVNRVLVRLIPGAVSARVRLGLKQLRGLLKIRTRLLKITNLLPGRKQDRPRRFD